MSIESQLVLRQALSRILTNTEVDGNFILLAQTLDSIMAGTAGFEAGNADKLGGQTAGQILTPAGWITPTLLNGWTNVGTPYATLRYFKDPLGIVHLQGFITGGTAWSPVCTLPAGYRPATDQAPTQTLHSEGGTTRVYVQGYGDVLIGVGGAINVGIVMSFRAEQ
jgi:hypothetical protein